MVPRPATNPFSPIPEIFYFFTNFLPYNSFPPTKVLATPMPHHLDNLFRRTYLNNIQEVGLHLSRLYKGNAAGTASLHEDATMLCIQSQILYCTKDQCY